jgi:hypothetical protein
VPPLFSGSPEVAPDAWPPDALSSLVAQSASNHVGGAVVAQSPPPRPYRLHDIAEQPDPFAAPHARGMAVRRQSNLGYGPHVPYSPPAAQVGGGINLQANWPAWGRSTSNEDEDWYLSGIGLAGERYSNSPPYDSPEPKNGPGHIPIGIRPSIQAQSAMLRELYPHGPLAAGPAGPLPAP